MSFLNSLPLWGGLAVLGVSLPILIHLWSRRQKIEIHWAAMELLKKAMVKRSQQIRMEDRLLLLLRCLTLLLVALALLRPLFRAVRAGGGSATGVVIGIDASYSMGCGQPARFQRALAKVRDVLSTMKAGDPVSIVLMSSHPEVLFRRTGYDAGAFNKGLAESAKATLYPLNLELNLDQLLELVDELKTATRECHIITDAQVSDWQGLSDQARNTLQKLGGQSHVMLTPLAPGDARDLAITDFSYAAGALQRDGSARFAATVRNTGVQAVEGATVEFSVGGKLRARRDVGRLGSGESSIVSFFTSFDTAGEKSLVARLSMDDLATANARYAIAGVRSSVRVLCMEGRAADESGEAVSGAFFALRALRLKYTEANAPIRVTRIDAGDAYGETFGDYDVVMMVNVADVNEDLGRRLVRFVDAGGGLMVFLGDAVDPEAYNRHLAAGAAPLLPARLVETVRHDDPTLGWRIVLPRSEHALATLVGKLPADLTAEARFHTAIRAVPLQNGEPILALDGGFPLLVSGRDGRVLLFTSSVDRSWNNLPVHPLFTILLQQSVTLLSRPAATSAGRVGEPVTVLLPGRMMGDAVTVQGPSGQTDPVKVTVADGSSAAVITPVTPGVYRVAAEAGREPVSIAVNVDPAESDVRAAENRTLARWLDGMPVELVSGDVAAAAINSRTGRELSLTLLALAVICFFAQGLWGNHMSRRKYAADTGVADAVQDRRVAAARRY